MLAVPVSFHRHGFSVNDYLHQDAPARFPRLLVAES
jgi:hypothetical protein